MWSEKKGLPLWGSPFNSLGFFLPFPVLPDGPGCPNAWRVLNPKDEDQNNDQNKDRNRRVHGWGLNSLYKFEQVYKNKSDLSMGKVNKITMPAFVQFDERQDLNGF